MSASLSRSWSAGQVACNRAWLALAGGEPSLGRRPPLTETSLTGPRRAPAVPWAAFVASVLWGMMIM